MKTPVIGDPVRLTNENMVLPVSVWKGTSLVLVSWRTLSPGHSIRIPYGQGLQFPEENLMATASAAFAPEGRIEDPLAYLPCSMIAAFRPREVIYNHDQPCNKIYLVIEGKVKVSRLVEGKHQVVIDIYQQDEFFGESAVLSLAQRSEEAVAMETTKLMTWSTTEIDEIIMKRPRLGLALLQIVVQRTLDLTKRIESFSVDSIPRRLARSLLRFADRMGETNEDGSIWTPPLTHETLAQIVGTSREIVTHYMTQFRRQGYLRYSRRGIMLYREALLTWLAE